MDRVGLEVEALVDDLGEPVVVAGLGQWPALGSKQRSCIRFWASVTAVKIRASSPLPAIDTACAVPCSMIEPRSSLRSPGRALSSHLSSARSTMPSATAWISAPQMYRPSLLVPSSEWSRHFSSSKSYLIA